jgi:hypothetical protein
MEDAEYVSIPLCKKYSINRLGEIIHIYKNGKKRVMKPYLEKHGYLRHTLTDNNGKNRKFYLHRLLALTFLQNPNNWPCIDHKDHNRQNNSLSNLKFATYLQNARNRKVNKNNNTGFRGVRYKKVGKREYFIATWSNEDSKERAKYFNIKKLGREEALKKAIEMRKEMEDLYYHYS